MGRNPACATDSELSLNLRLGSKVPVRYNSVKRDYVGNVVGLAILCRRSVCREG